MGIASPASKTDDGTLVAENRRSLSLPIQEGDDHAEDHDTDGVE